MVATLGTLAVMGYLFYLLFIKGVAWPILGFIFGVYGGKLLIQHLIPASSATIITFLSYEVSWAAFIAGIISLLAIGYFMKDEQ
jgi:hypothetical protein